ncbi:PREDICTED: uncharacterized protein LOC109176752 [Ipomoea nil]|uniref:uncharacterized protein LOC109176752 n=1 Tax=Ipomoea nil TaxID=35883 RepID=UPI000901ABCA|nr:PREDICTED: uncharacterized protein LOC109176752 [Ipomoea nil]
MSVFLLPETLCISLERLMNRYWWDKSSTEKGIHWLAWDKMCVPKKYGGLGFKRLHEFNLALHGKQGWCLLTNPASLMARVFKARYFPKTSFLEAILGGCPSYVWRSVMASQMLIRGGCRRMVGDGSSTKVWLHPWLPDPQDPYVRTTPTDTTRDLWVSNLIDPVSNEWKREFIHQLFEPRDANLIIQIPANVDYEDISFWFGDTRGCYSVKEGVEDVMHVLCSCSYAKRVWDVSNLPVPPINDDDFMQWVASWLDNSAGRSCETKGKICGLLHELWKARNHAVWDGFLPTPAAVCRSFHLSWNAWKTNITTRHTTPYPQPGLTALIST